MSLSTHVCLVTRWFLNHESCRTVVQAAGLRVCPATVEAVGRISVQEDARIAVRSPTVFPKPCSISLPTRSRH